MRGERRAIPPAQPTRVKTNQHWFRRVEQRIQHTLRSRPVVPRISRAHSLDCWSLGRRPEVLCYYLVGPRRGGAGRVPDVISKAAQVIRYERRNRRRIMSRVDLQCACCLVVTGAHYQRRGRGQLWDRGKGPVLGSR